MFSILKNSRLLQCSFLTRLLQTTGLSLALMMASAAGVRAADANDTDIEIGADGAPGIGDPFPNVTAGPGQPAAANAAASSATGNATATARATGGNGGISFGENIDVPGGDADATSTAKTTGPGGATSTATATGGNIGIGGFGSNAPGGSATATADAAATGGGRAFATAVATTGASDFDVTPVPAANASSSAETANGAMAQALSSINSPFGELAGTGEATAETSFGGVSVQSNATTQHFFGTSATVEAIAQVGGSGPTALDPELFTGAISIALPDKAYATTLIDGASNVADALLRPGFEIFGIAILGGFDVSATIDFNFRGDLILGDVSDNSVSNLGFGGPDGGLSISDTFGIFVIGGAVPEPSTWAMMLLGFAGLGFLGWRGSRNTAAHAA
jgi:hypothetical protein